MNANTKTKNEKSREKKAREWACKVCNTRRYYSSSQCRGKIVLFRKLIKMPGQMMNIVGNVQFSFYSNFTWMASYFRDKHDFQQHILSLPIYHALFISSPLSAPITQLSVYLAFIIGVLLSHSMLCSFPVPLFTGFVPSSSVVDPSGVDHAYISPQGAKSNYMAISCMNYAKKNPCYPVWIEGKNELLNSIVAIVVIVC